MTDSYALGVIAYQLLLGRAVDPHQPVPRPEPESPEIPLGFEALLRDLLASDPRRRCSIEVAVKRIAWLQSELEPRADNCAESGDGTPAEIAADIRRLRRTPRGTVRTALGIAGLAAAAAAMLVMAAREPATSSRVVANVMPLAPVADTVPAAAPPAVEPVAVPAERPVVTPVVAPPPPAPAVVAKAAPSKRRAESAPRPVAQRDRNRVEPDPTTEVLTRYQRVGRALHQLQKQRGLAATTELWQQFRGLAIQPALATPRSRAAASALLTELQEKIERQQGVTVADACLDNPLADGCR